MIYILLAIVANYIFIKLVEESSSARERQNCPAILI